MHLEQKNLKVAICIT